jgi:hypothetical protein
MQEEKRDREIAEQLGITYEELGETSFDIEDHEGNDGAIYGHYVRFSENSSKEVLDKIVGLENLCIDIHLTDEQGDDDFDPNDDGGIENLPIEIQNLGNKIMPGLAEEARRKRD